MFDDPTLLPLRTVALQILFLFMAVAIEATVLQKQLGLEPKESVHFAAALNLFCVVLGWLVFFTVFNLSSLLPGEAIAPLISFILFDSWSNETATILIISCFIIFFASLIVKEVGLLGLYSLLRPERFAESAADATNDATNATDIESPDAPNPVFVETARSERSTLRAELQTLLYANAWSYSAILFALLIRQAFL